MPALPTAGMPLSLATVRPKRSSINAGHFLAADSARAAVSPLSKFAIFQKLVSTALLGSGCIRRWPFFSGLNEYRRGRLRYIATAFREHDFRQQYIARALAQDLQQPAWPRAKRSAAGYRRRSASRRWDIKLIVQIVWRIVDRGNSHRAKLFDEGLG
jgi:hypothetical protein